MRARAVRSFIVDEGEVGVFGGLWRVVGFDCCYCRCCVMRLRVYVFIYYLGEEREMVSKGSLYEHIDQTKFCVADMFHEERSAGF